MNLYSWGVICSSNRIRTRSHRVRMVVKFCSPTIRWGYGTDAFLSGIISSTGALLMKTVTKHDRQ